jgi:predicted Fe-S protein YdhL (DUF1289 family)
MEKNIKGVGKVKRHTLQYEDYDRICFSAERWDLMSDNEKMEVLRTLSIALLDIRDFVIKAMDRNIILKAIKSPPPKKNKKSSN